MLQDLKKRPDENERQYIWRVASQKEAGLIHMSWDELTEHFNNELGYDHQAEASYRKPYNAAKAYYEDVFSKFMEDAEREKRLYDLRRDIQIEREKLRTDRLETNRWLREYARDELIVERLVEAAKCMQPLSIPDRISYAGDGNRSAVLCFGDEHYGTEFKVYGLNGETLNEYSPEIFEERMWALYDEVIHIVQKEQLQELYIFSMGDYIDGIIRASQLMQLRYGVIDGTIKYAHFLSTWLNLISSHVAIHFQMVHGNHSELRLIGQPKGSFTRENTGKFVLEFIKERLRDNPNIHITTNPSGLIFDTICGFNVLGVHGEVKDMSEAIKEFSLMYHKNIDVLIGGHMHHYKAETVGVETETINVPSIIGIDDYSVKLRRTSSPGALLFMLTEDKGKTLEYHIKL